MLAHQATLEHRMEALPSEVVESRVVALGRVQEEHLSVDRQRADERDGARRGSGPRRIRQASQV